MEPLLKSVFQNTEIILDEIYKSVAEQEALATRGRGGGKGTYYFKLLRETKVHLGNPNDEIIRLHVQEAADNNKGMLKRKYQGKKIYFLSLSVSFRSGYGVQFSRVWCELSFNQKKGQEVIIQQIFPAPEWKTVITYGASLKLALDSALKWVVAPTGNDSVQQLQKSLPADISANFVNENTISSFIQVHPYLFEMGRAEIAATGTGSNTAFWDISKPDLQKAQTAKFIVVFTVPKDVKKVKLLATVAAEPSFPIAVANLSDVWEFLGERIQNLLQKLDSERTPEERLPIGDQEEWEIDLPEK